MSSPSPPVPGSPCGYQVAADMQPSSLYQHLQRLHLQQSQFGGATSVTPSSSFSCRSTTASPLLPHSKVDVTNASPTHHRNSPPPNNLHIIKEDSFDACDALARHNAEMCDCKAKLLPKPHISITDTHGHVTSMLTSHDDALSTVKLSVNGNVENATATTVTALSIDTPVCSGKYPMPTCFTWNPYPGLPQYPAVDLANIPTECAMDVDGTANTPASSLIFTSQLAALQAQKGRQAFTTFNLDSYCNPWDTCSNFARSISTGSGQPSKHLPADTTNVSTFSKLYENA